MKIFEGILSNRKFRDTIYKVMLPVPILRYKFTNIFAKQTDRSEFNKLKIAFKLFIIQYVCLIPIILYDQYYKFFVLKKVLDKNRKFSGEIKNIGIYSPKFDKYAGGGEKVTAHLAQFFEQKYPNAYIEVICNDWFGEQNKIPATIEEINSKYGTSLQRTVVKVYDHSYDSVFYYKFERLFIEKSEEFDIFINCFINSLPANALINIHYVHFPYPIGDSKNKLLFEMYCKSYDYFITNSKYTQFWTNKYLNVTNSEVLYPPVIINSNSDIPKKSNIILSVGRLTPDKNIDVMINAFNSNIDRLYDYEFHIVGALNSQNAVQMEYYNYLKNLSDSPRIVFKQNLSYSELSDCFRKSKFYWHSKGYGTDPDYAPGDYEHFGITIVEAMSYAAVPIVIATGGPAEIVNDSHAGLTWNTPEELILQTISLINDNDLLKKLQSNCLKNSSNYSVERFEEGLDKIIEKIILSKSS